MKDQINKGTPPLRGRGASFAPLLTIPNGTTDVSFYKDAFGAAENFILHNDDGSIHVAEFDLDGSIFHLHEVTEYSNSITPEQAGGYTTSIGLFVDDVHALFDKAIVAGAELKTPVTDYDYGYRQGEFVDPFGHRWIIQCRIPASPEWQG